MSGTKNNKSNKGRTQNKNNKNRRYSKPKRSLQDSNIPAIMVNLAKKCDDDDDDENSLDELHDRIGRALDKNQSFLISKAFDLAGEDDAVCDSLKYVLEEETYNPMVESSEGEYLQTFSFAIPLLITMPVESYNEKWDELLSGPFFDDIVKSFRKFLPISQTDSVVVDANLYHPLEIMQVPPVQFRRYFVGLSRKITHKEPSIHKLVYKKQKIERTASPAAEGFFITAPRILVGTMMSYLCPTDTMDIDTILFDDEYKPQRDILENYLAEKIAACLGIDGVRVTVLTTVSTVGNSIYESLSGQRACGLTSSFTKFLEDYGTEPDNLSFNIEVLEESECILNLKLRIGEEPSGLVIFETDLQAYPNYEDPEDFMEETMELFKRVVKDSLDKKTIKAYNLTKSVCKVLPFVFRNNKVGNA